MSAFFRSDIASPLTAYAFPFTAKVTAPTPSHSSLPEGTLKGHLLPYSQAEMTSPDADFAATGARDNIKLIATTIVLYFVSILFCNAYRPVSFSFLLLL